MGKKSKTINGSGLEIAEIDPLTARQVAAFESEKNLVLYGCAGTGKTFVGCYLAYDDMSKGLYERLVIIRSAVPTRDIGYLPGTLAEKTSVYEEPYKDIATDIFQRGDAYQILKTKNLVHFMTTSYLRGITLRDAVIVIDECQNMTFHELDSIITRIGRNCRIIFSGDFDQSDLKNNGLGEFLSILEYMQEFDFVEFTVRDVVRSEFVKNYIIAKQTL